VPLDQDSYDVEVVPPQQQQEEESEVLPPPHVLLSCLRKDEAPVFGGNYTRLASALRVRGQCAVIRELAVFKESVCSLV
jgi:hypothetical protein